MRVFETLNVLLYVRVTTILENLEMSENFAAVREMSGNWPFVGGMSGKKSCQGKLLFLMNKPVLIEHL